MISGPHTGADAMLWFARALCAVCVSCGCVAFLCMFVQEEQLTSAAKSVPIMRVAVLNFGSALWETGTAKYVRDGVQ